MREIHADNIASTVAQLCKTANFELPSDFLELLKRAVETERSPIGKEILEILLENATQACQDRLPSCQDSGMVVAFLEVGQDAHIVGGGLTEAINRGVRQGYLEGYLRKSVVKSPLWRENTGDNTPAIIFTELVPGDFLDITIMPKGFGSENMGQVHALVPADGIEGVENFVVNVVREAEANPCPPLVVGVGIGGTLEKAALLAKKALLRPLQQPNADPRVAEIEERLLRKINQLGIGPQGLGGDTTALKVQIETFPTHIAGLPVAVNTGCHAMRHAHARL